MWAVRTRLRCGAASTWLRGGADRWLAGGVCEWSTTYWVTPNGYRSWRQECNCLADGLFRSLQPGVRSPWTSRFNGPAAAQSTSIHSAPSLPAGRQNGALSEAGSGIEPRRAQTVRSGMWRRSQRVSRGGAAHPGAGGQWTIQKYAEFQYCWELTPHGCDFGAQSNCNSYQASLCDYYVEINAHHHSLSTVASWLLVFVVLVASMVCVVSVFHIGLSIARTMMPV